MFRHVVRKGIFSFSRIFLRFKIDFSAHFDPENILGWAIGRLLKNWIFEVFGDFEVPDWVSARLFTNFQFGRCGFNFWKKICFLGQFLTLNRMSRSKTTFEQQKLVIWPCLSQKQAKMTFFDSNRAKWPAFIARKSFLTCSFDSASKIDPENIYVLKSWNPTSQTENWCKRLAEAETQSGTPDHLKTHLCKNRPIALQIAHPSMFSGSKWAEKSI